jgi:hypothetical protein
MQYIYYYSAWVLLIIYRIYTLVSGKVWNELQLQYMLYVCVCGYISSLYVLHEINFYETRYSRCRSCCWTLPRNYIYKFLSSSNGAKTTGVIECFTLESSLFSVTYCNVSQCLRCGFRLVNRFIGFALFLTDNQFLHSINYWNYST